MQIVNPQTSLAIFFCLFIKKCQLSVKMANGMDVIWTMGFQTSLS